MRPCYAGVDPIYQRRFDRGRLSCAFRRCMRIAVVYLDDPEITRAFALEDRDPMVRARSCPQADRHKIIGATIGRRRFLRPESGSGYV